MKKIFLLICVGLLGVSAFAQEISLVTSGEGKTKNEATAAALRSAVEQSFGTFVSANTTILNDDVVRDEIATVASGNIKSYKELSCVQNNAGIYNVSVSAVVSIGKLISYAKSHGSLAEFAGQTFAMNMKMRDLNKKNETEALNNLLVQLKAYQNGLFNYELKVDEPRKDSESSKWIIPIILVRKTTTNYITFMQSLVNTLRSLSLTSQEITGYKQNNIEYNELKLGDQPNNSFYLRSDINSLNNFAEDICDILTLAQESCVIKEKGGKGQQLFPRFSDDFLCLSDQKSKTVSVSYRNRNSNQQLPINTGKTLQDMVFFVYEDMDDIGNLSGFNVAKFPLSTINDKTKRFSTIAKQLNIPYTSENGKIKIPISENFGFTTRKGEINMDLGKDKVKIDTSHEVVDKAAAWIDNEKYDANSDMHIYQSRSDALTMLLPNGGITFYPTYCVDMRGRNETYKYRR